MRIDPAETIAGVRLVAVRDFLRRHMDAEFSAARLADRLKITAEVAEELLDALQHRGVVTAARTDPTEPAYWRTTVAGNQLAMASAAPPVRRAVAERHLTELLERVRAVNADPKSLFWVTEVVLFGSILDPGREQVSDVDVAVRITPRLEGESLRMALTEYGNEQVRAGRRYSDYIDFVSWADSDLRRYLKSGSRVLSVHDLHTDHILDVAEKRTIYRWDGDEA